MNPVKAKRILKDINAGQINAISLRTNVIAVGSEAIAGLLKGKWI